MKLDKKTITSLAILAIVVTIALQSTTLYVVLKKPTSTVHKKINKDKVYSTN